MSWSASWSARRKRRSAAVVIASATYVGQRPDAVVGILTTKLPERRARRITSFRTGDPLDSAQSPASERTS